MSELTKDLRNRTRLIDYGHGDYGRIPDDECIQAADRIEALEEGLRELLTLYDAGIAWNKAQDKARALLEEK